MSRFVLDSWAWVEYLRGSEPGRRVREEIEKGAELITHAVTVAEVVSKFKREGLDEEGAWRAMTTSSRIVRLDGRGAREVGLLHALVKKVTKNFSLADAFALHTAREMKAKVLTGDPDFRGIQEAVLLK